MDVAGLIASFATGTYTVTRTARGSITRGKTASGTTSTTTITAAVWPAAGNDLKRLPENRRATEAMNIMTATLLYVGGQGSSYEADQIAIGSESYEVSDVDTWTDPVSGSIGYKCLATVIR
jgi:hypothetical protein